MGHVDEKLMLERMETKVTKHQSNHARNYGLAQTFIMLVGLAVIIALVLSFR